MPTTVMTLADTLKTLGLVGLSVLLLPFSLLVLAFSYLYTYFVAPPPPHPSSTPSPQNGRTILVTGVGMAKGLTLARAFHLSGHRVVGADFEPGKKIPIPCSGRFSRSLSAFYRLQNPGADADADSARRYIADLVSIVQREKVDLWVSCSGVSNALVDALAKEAIEKSRKSACIQFDARTTASLHEKDAFITTMQSMGLPVPETHTFTSAADLRDFLVASAEKGGRKYILKPVGVDDANRANMTLLPLSSAAATRAYVDDRIGSSVGVTSPWLAQQFIPGGREYCTHALVVRGQVRAFTACRSAELLMHYAGIPPPPPPPGSKSNAATNGYQEGEDSAVYAAMLAFTKSYLDHATKTSASATSMTGHLSFDFMVEDGAVYAIECNPRAHTAVVLFAQPGFEMQRMVENYLSALDDDNDDKTTTSSSSVVPAIPPHSALPRYWLAHDLITFLIHPLINLILSPSYQVLGVGQGHGQTVEDFLAGVSELATHVLTWKEGTFEVWDPLPAIVLYHVYWPLTILSAWMGGRRWSRVNVSTTKMFLC